jgi:hypothetical protein
MRKDILVNKTASLLCLLLAGCVVDDTDPELSEHEAALDDDPDEYPDEYPPVAPTSSFRLTDRAPDSIAMRWTTPANVTTTRVQRRVVGGSWTNVKTYLTTSGVLSYRNSGLAQDTRYCYRIAVYNADGAAFTPEKCALTEVPGSPSLSRVRLELRVADVSGAGTTDLVSVSLNDTAFGNFTGLDYSINDFARNSTFRYDLDMNGIPVLHDIANITIRKYGTDSLCLRSFRLLLNEVTAYSRTFGNTSTTCHLLNASGSSTFTVTHAQLRASSTFTSWQPPFPPQLVISQEEIEERLEGIMGDLIWNSPHVQWGELDGSEYVEVAPVPGSPQELAVSYDLPGRQLVQPRHQRLPHARGGRHRRGQQPAALDRDHRHAGRCRRRHRDRGAPLDRQRDLRRGERRDLPEHPRGLRLDGGREPVRRVLRAVRRRHRRGVRRRHRRGQRQRRPRVRLRRLVGMMRLPDPSPRLHL